MQTVGILGGTGVLGKAIAVSVFQNYEKVLIGSRSIDRARSVVEEIITEKNGLQDSLLASTNEQVASNADIIIASLPHRGTISTIELLYPNFKGNQLLISAVAPVEKSGNEFYSPSNDQDKSISQQISDIVGDKAEVATAFQTIPAKMLYSGKEISADVPVCCKKEVYRYAAEVVNQIKGLRPLYVGGLNQSKQIEGLTSFLLNIAMGNKLKSPTIKINSF